MGDVGSGRNFEENGTDKSDSRDGSGGDVGNVSTIGEESGYAEGFKKGVEGDDMIPLGKPEDDKTAEGDGTESVAVVYSEEESESSSDSSGKRAEGCGRGAFFVEEACEF